METPLLEITFGKSPSAHYERAMHLAQRLPGYHGSGTGSNVLHSLVWTSSPSDAGTWEQLEELLQVIAGWNSTRLKVAGREMHYARLAGYLNHIRTCYARKLRRGAGDDYCSGKSTPTDEASYFGCRCCYGVARQVDALTSEGTSWIRYGTLTRKRDAFRVDKQAILKALNQDSRTAACKLCPAFRWQRVCADVDELPELIKLGPQSLFQVRYAAFNPAHALGIEPKAPPDSGAVAIQLGVTRLEKQRDPSSQRNVPKVRYTDIAGQDAALEQLKNVVELPLSHAAYFEALRVQPQSGIILYGPPGNGKTLLAKAVASESNAHFELISGPEILSRWVGQSEASLRRIFARARQLCPSVVLIDELDSIAPRREWLSAQHEVQLLSQLLVLLDGLEARGRVAVVATTNRLEAIDPAVRRPGRFDYHIEVPCPDEAGRAAILRVCLAKLKTRQRLRVEGLAKATTGFSGAELAALCREAGIHAIRRGIASGLAAPRLVVTRADVHQALQTLRAKRVPEQSLVPVVNFFPAIASTCSPTRGKD
ncbi:MAG TPA: AAA family ATPase [Gemmataceae bacterium]|jgi:ATP-dependent 26S proteasome regulatory subunit|nr:AAA family ATPase [Gemmataceae bacterium]